MAAFHLSWFSFFCVFVSTFGPASLVPYIKVDLGLSAVDLGNAAVASVISAVFSRIAIGVVCDLVGARYAVSAVLLATAFPVFFFYFVTNAAGYIATRFFIGLSLSVFVCCQYW